MPLTLGERTKSLLRNGDNHKYHLQKRQRINLSLRVQIQPLLSLGEKDKILASSCLVKQLTNKPKYRGLNPSYH